LDFCVFGCIYWKESKALWSLGRFESRYHVGLPREFGKQEKKNTTDTQLPNEEFLAFYSHIDRLSKRKK